MNTFHTLILSDFTADYLERFLEEEGAVPDLQCTVAPYDQVIPLLMNPNAPIWQKKTDFLVVWTQPEKVSAQFAQALKGSSISESELISEVKAFAEHIEQNAQRCKACFIPSWQPMFSHPQHQLNAWQTGTGISYWLQRMNLCLAESIKDIPNAYMLNANAWQQEATWQDYAPRLWYMGKIPFALPVFQAAAQNIQKAINTLLGATKKLLILDLDDTLWGNEIGEVGIEGILLGAPDARGEAFVAFQEALQTLKNRGLLLALCSKNTEEIALQAIDTHPDMKLRSDDFVCWRINWQNKAQNIREIVTELNLGLHSVVFLDNSPTERDLVRQQLPDVAVPELPEDVMDFVPFLNRLPYWDQTNITQEDRQKTQLYKADQQRQKTQITADSYETWLHSLQIEITVESITNTNQDRALQLLNKTNQMNLTTRRFTEPEFSQILQNENAHFWAFRVQDRFGAYGLIGIIGIEQNQQQITVTDYVLSCRVLGRGVEETMLGFALERGIEMGAQQIELTYHQTPNNAPMHTFLTQSDLLHTLEGNAFIWDKTHTIPQPSHITLHGAHPNQP